MRIAMSDLIRVCVAVVLSVGAVQSIALADAEIVDFESDRWLLKDAKIAQHLGRTCLTGVAQLKDVEFTNGIIEVDIAVDGRRTYPGIIFRVQSDDAYERFYIRPHKSDWYYDALQYAPVFNGVACWQLFSGPGFTASASIPVDRWIHLKMVVRGKEAQVFWDNAKQPALVIEDLKHGVSKGTIGVFGPNNSTAYFSNFSYTPGDDDDVPESFAPNPPRGVIKKWEISQAYSVFQMDTQKYPPFFGIFGAQWQKVEAEPSGLVNLSRHVARANRDGDCVMARTVFQSKRRTTLALTFGYSDAVSIFINGKIAYSGNSAYKSRNPSFAGIIGWNDMVYLPLEKGLNEILLIVTESFGGWGFMCKGNRVLLPPVVDHGLLTKAWETPADFKIPESVLYDRVREILYVSSFDKVISNNVDTGFISKVKLDGEIEELEWVTGLDGPCGMGLVGDRLYVVEGLLCNLVEIDVNTGEILTRHEIAGCTFLNDVTTDDAGNVYVTNTSRSLGGEDIYKFANGEIEIWKKGPDLHRSNGVFFHDGRLIVGCTGDGLLKTVGLEDRRVDVVTSLGAGIIDGIRIDNQGNYIVSHWEGKLYRISPEGDIVEILDTHTERLNLADFEFVKEKNLLIVPTFLGNKVVAYELKTPPPSGSDK